MTWIITPDKILTRDEVVAVLTDLNTPRRKNTNRRLNRIIFRLATCCGLRASELTGLTLNDVRLGSARPKITVPAEIAKGGKARVVPMIDQGTLDDLQAWKTLRESQGAQPGDLFIVSQDRRSFGNKIDRRTARLRFKQACKVLGAERQDEITIHHGRHSFISHALHQGYNVVQVQHMVGHSSLATTSLYSHLVSDGAEIGNLFA